jgi:hypothetical protein
MRAVVDTVGAAHRIAPEPDRRDDAHAGFVASMTRPLRVPLRRIRDEGIARGDGKTKTARGTAPF